MAEESKLQTRIIKDLKKSGWLVNKIMLCSMTGWPDIFAMKKFKAQFPLTSILFIEVKSKGKKATPLQRHVHDQIIAQGGNVYVTDSWESYQQIKYLL